MQNDKVSSDRSSASEKIMDAPVVYGPRTSKESSSSLIDATNGDLHSVNENNQDLNQVDDDDDGNTVLIAASYKGDTEVVDLLLSRISGTLRESALLPPFDINKQNKNGSTALMMASYNGHTKVVRSLLAVPGLDVNKQDRGGSTALI
jgi:ankyrin repeat protein